MRDWLTFGGLWAVWSLWIGLVGYYWWQLRRGA